MYPSSTNHQNSPELAQHESAVGGRAALLFLAVIGLLTVFAYITPVSLAWQYSLYHEAPIDAFDMAGAAREGNMERKLAFGSLGLLGLAGLLWSEGKRLRVFGILGVACVAYVAWCALTCLWAADPSTAMRRLGLFFCVIAAALAVAKHSTPRQFVWFVFTCTLAWLGLGIVAESSLGTFISGHHAYRFAGVFHANGMGEVCAMLTMSSLYLARGAKRGKYLLCGVAVVALAFLYLTRSRTAIGAMMVSIGAAWLFMVPLPRVLFRNLVGVVGIAVLLVPFALGIIDVNRNSVSMGRQDHDLSSFTGRVPIWQEVGQYIRDRPFLGHGFSAFWNSEHITEVSRRIGWAVSAGHSAYVDLVLDVGFIGAGLCISAMILAFFAAARREPRQPWQGYGFIAMIVVYGLSAGLLESTINISSFLTFFGIAGVSYLVLPESGTDRSTSAGEEPEIFIRGQSFFERLATNDKKLVATTAATK